MNHQLDQLGLEHAVCDALRPALALGHTRRERVSRVELQWRQMSATLDLRWIPKCYLITIVDTAGQFLAVQMNNNGYSWSVPSSSNEQQWIQLVIKIW